MKIIKTSSTQITPEVGQILNSYSTSPLNTYSCNYINENGGGGVSPTDLLNYIYPIGSIYMSVNNVSPQVFLGGTWKQITNDAYLKIVSSNAGSLGGTSSDHKIPLNNSPSHNHRGRYRGGALGQYYFLRRINSGDGYDGEDQATYDSGGGQAYYPYYLGVYVWKRTA